jgi:hypothetical protein
MAATANHRPSATALVWRSAPPVAVPRPRLRAIVARTAASLAVACVVPAALFSVVLVASGVYVAVVAALAWACGAMCWRWATRRPVSGLLVLTLAIMAVRSGFTLATGNTFVYFIQPVFADATVAVLFLASLLTARPLVARLAPDFYPMDTDLAARPRIRRLFWRLTLMWGVVILAKGAVTLWLLESRSTVDFVVTKNAAVIALTALAAGTTIWLSAIVGRKEGMLAHA